MAERMKGGANRERSTWPCVGDAMTDFNQVHPYDLLRAAGLVVVESPHFSREVTYFPEVGQVWCRVGLSPERQEEAVDYVITQAALIAAEDIPGFGEPPSGALVR